MKKFKLKIFLVATTVMVLMSFLSLSGLEAHNAPNNADTLSGIIGSTWIFFRFPIFTFFGRYLYSHGNLLLFSTALFLDCAFYGLLSERIFSLRWKKQKEGGMIGK